MGSDLALSLKSSGVRRCTKGDKSVFGVRGCRQGDKEVWGVRGSNLALSLKEALQLIAV